MDFSHLDSNGSARMVDVSEKDMTVREAVASGRVIMHGATLREILNSDNPKGDVLSAARIGGIMGAKKTAELIPLCHNIPIDSVKVDFSTSFDGDCSTGYIDITAIARTTWKTGVEMEALTAVSVAGLIIYDMCKAVDKDIEITSVKLEKKTGGKSGEYVRVK